MNIRLAEIFANNMTLQRGKKNRVWGIAMQAGKLTVKLNQVVVYEDWVNAGEFTIYLPEQPAMEAAKLIIGNQILENVDFGEVWIAGGQSNMEFLLRYDKEAKETISQANDPHLRYYCVGKYTFEEQENDGLENDTFWNKWLSFNEDVAEQFLAVAVYFALELRKKYEVPVAIVGCTYGGTTASAWIDESYLTKKSHIYLQEYENQTKNLNLPSYFAANDELRKKIVKVQGEMMDAILFGGEHAKVFFENAQKQAEEMGGNTDNQELLELMNQMGPRHQNRPGGLYHVMLQKITGFTTQGVIWYQGESDDAHADIYSDLFTKMIQCWRDAWQEELPFLFVQLAPYAQWLDLTGDKFPELRAEQQKVADSVNNVWMVSSSDVGDEYDIHPKEKKPIGQRLAYTAMNRVYYDDVSYEAPRAKDITVNDNQVTITFDGAKNLKIEGDELKYLTVSAGEKRIPVVATSVEENKLGISLQTAPLNQKLEVQFAMTPYYQVNLYNEADLPAFPFSLKVVSTDDIHPIF